MARRKKKGGSLLGGMRQGLKDKPKTKPTASKKLLNVIVGTVFVIAVLGVVGLMLMRSFWPEYGMMDGSGEFAIDRVVVESESPEIERAVMVPDGTAGIAVFYIPVESRDDEGLQARIRLNEEQLGQLAAGDTVRTSYRVHPPWRGLSVEIVEWERVKASE